MRDLITEYYGKIDGILKEIMRDERDSVEKAAVILAEAVVHDRLLWRERQRLLERALGVHKVGLPVPQLAEQLPGGRVALIQFDRAQKVLLGQPRPASVLQCHASPLLRPRGAGCDAYRAFPEDGLGEPI